MRCSRNALKFGCTSVDQDERKQAYDTVQQIIVDQALGAFYGQRAFSTIYNDRVGGIQIVGQGAPVFDKAYVK